MNSPSSLDPVVSAGDPPAEPAASPRMRTAYTIVLALFLSSTSVVASAPLVAGMVEQGLPNSPFASDAAALTFLRVAVGVWAVVFSLLQAFILALLVGAIGRVRRPRLQDSWFWVLVGQIPQLAIILAVQLIGGPDAMGPVTSVPARVAFGVIGTVIYSLLATRACRLDARRATLVAALTISLNVAFILLNR